MLKKYKTSIKWLLAWLLWATVLLVAFFTYVLPLTFYNAGAVRGELDEKIISPNGRWNVELRTINMGAIGSSHHARVEDLKGQVPIHEIMLPAWTKTNLHWADADTINIFGAITNVRTGKVIEERSVSPNKRWRIDLFYIVPVDGRYRPDDVKYYVEVFDLKARSSKNTMPFDIRGIQHTRIRWKSDDTVDVYGKIINVSKLSP